MAKKPIKVGNSTRVLLAAYAGQGGGGDAATLDGQAAAYYLARANHTGTQLAATISDLSTAINAGVGSGATTFQNTIRLTGAITPPPIAAHTNNYNPAGLATANILFLDATANYDLTGLEAQENGRVLFIQNISTNGDIKLKNNNANSLAANRFFLNADATIKKGMGTTIIYNSTLQRWLINQIY